MEGRRTKRAEALRKTFGGSFLSSCRKWFVFRLLIGGRMVMPGHLVVETIGKQCDVRQEEEYDDERMDVGFSFIDPEGAGNACSLYRGSSTPWSEKLDHEGALLVKFKGTCAAIEQYEPFKELEGLSFFRTVGRRTDARRYTWSSVARTDARTHGPTVNVRT